MQTSDLKRFYGVTVTDIWDKNLEAKFKKLDKDPSKTIARIVIDKVDDYTDYIGAFQLVGKYAQCLLQVSDSYLDSQLTDEEYNAREMWFLENLSEYANFVEIGNEAGPFNNWSSKNMPDRVRRSSLRWAGHERILTSFWGDDIETMDTWLKHDEIDCEHQLLSFYPSKIEDFASLIALQNLNDGIGLSEFGFENWQGHISDKMKKVLIARAYKIGSPVCLWDWQKNAEY